VLIFKTAIDKEDNSDTEQERRFANSKDQ